MTGDVDVAATHLALGADPPERLEGILRRADATFESVMPLAPGAPPSRFGNAEGYLMDLLTPTRSRIPNPLPVEALDAGAAPLQHLAWLIEDPVSTLALWGAVFLSPSRSPPASRSTS